MATRKLNTNGKAVEIVAVTLDATETFDGLIVGGGGDVSLVPLNGSTPVVLTLPAGVWPIAFSKITTANTDATGLFGTIEGTSGS
jgi:hypothetical protein